MTAPTTRRAAGDLLTLGFATTVAMWTVGYLLRMPGAAVPAPALLAAVLGIAIVGGFCTGRWTSRGIHGGLLVGLISGALNLLIVGGLVSGHNRPNEIVPAALWYVPGSLLVTAGLAALGAALGNRPRVHTVAGAEFWAARFAAVAAVATLVLISAGGLVTSHDAGLAVPDWPNSFGYGMFLYPLARMTGGVYFEHAHRLFGSLVGLTTVVLAIYLFVVERRGWVKGLAAAAVVAVIGQGVLGGLRVTGKLTLDTTPETLAPSIVLAMVHAVTAQVFLCMLVALWIVLSPTWAATPHGDAAARRTGDRGLALALVVLVLVQSVLGALLRHRDWGLHLHITLAVGVLVLAGLLGFRIAARHGQRPPLPRFGTLLIWATIGQFVLGLAALVVTRFAPAAAVSRTIEALIATAHQTMGALLLAAAFAVWLWHARYAAASAPRGVPLSGSVDPAGSPR